ncbi:MAG: flagellar motor switch protein FliN [Gammaproteobacteria bacterium]|nr:MAG: flagellar motor switch protein FliN [Gammaproteobacteria bacterium]
MSEPQTERDAELAGEWAAALEQQDETAAPESEAKPERKPEATAGATDGQRNLDLVLDIPVTISMEIGRVKVPIRNLLQLTQGSVVELERLAGEPLDVMVNGTLIAHGEVVVVNERYGIRFTDVVSPAERVQRLR